MSLEKTFQHIGTLKSLFQLIVYRKFHGYGYKKGDSSFFNIQMHLSSALINVKFYLETFMESLIVFILNTPNVKFLSQNVYLLTAF